MLPLYYYNKVEIASVFHIHVCRMWKTRRSLHRPVGAGHARPAHFPPPPVTALHTPSHPYIVGRGLDPSAARQGRRPLQRWPETTPHPRTFRPAPAHPSAAPSGPGMPGPQLPAACRQSSTAHPFPKPPNPATRFPPTNPIICARQPPSPQYTPCPNFSLRLCRKNQKNLQKPVDKGHTNCYNNPAVSRAQPSAAAAGAFTYSLYTVF